MALDETTHRLGRRFWPRVVVTKDEVRHVYLAAQEQFHLLGENGERRYCHCKPKVEYCAPGYVVVHRVLKPN